MTPLSEWTDSEIETAPSSENQLGKYQRCGRLKRKRVVIAAIVLTALLALVVGFLIGYFVPKPGASGRKDVRDEFEARFEDEVSATKVEEEFR